MVSFYKMEIFKDIEWYWWDYQIWNLSTVISKKRWRNEMKKWIDKDWYCVVTFCKNWEKKTFRVWKLVWLYFIENPMNKKEINHKDWVRSNDVATNLEWTTHWENQAHSYKFLWKVPSWWHKWKFWWFHHAAKKISQLSIEWEIIKIWDSVADAERWLWLNWKNISMCATWKYKTAYWYKWIYS